MHGGELDRHAAHVRVGLLDPAHRLWDGGVGLIRTWIRDYSPGTQLNQSIYTRFERNTHVEDLREQLPVLRVRAGRPAGVLVAAAVTGLAAVEEELEVPTRAGAEHGHVVEVRGRALHHRLGLGLDEGGRVSHR